MPKLMVIPNCCDDIDRLIDSVEAIVVGIRDLSVNFLEVDLDDIEELTNKIHTKNKKIFISINKNMHNKDLEEVKKVLIRCQTLDVDGIFYSDVGVLKLHQKLALNIPLVWSAEHLTTNYNTINYWSKYNVSYAFLSNEITKEEADEISKCANIPLIVQGFGYIPMYVSKRHAIDNYLKHFNLNANSTSFYIFKEDKKYPIKERTDSTEIYSSFILNAIAEYNDSDFEYLLLNGFKVKIDLFLEVINLFRTVTNENKLEFKERIDKMFPNTDLGFLYKEAIYQVKKNEK